MKTKSVSKFFLFAFVVSQIGLSAMAATQGSVILQGTVAKVVSLSVTGIGTYNALDLSATATDLDVATIDEASNDPSGYTVTLASSNSGALKNGNIGSVNYTAKYAGTSVTLSSTAQTITNAGTTTSTVSASKTLSVSYSGQALSNLMAGTYSDTLTFTIAAK